MKTVEQIREYVVDQIRSCRHLEKEASRREQTYREYAYDATASYFRDLLAYIDDEEET